VRCTHNERGHVPCPVKGGRRIPARSGSDRPPHGCAREPRTHRHAGPTAAPPLMLPADAGNAGSEKRRRYARGGQRTVAQLQMSQCHEEGADQGAVWKMYVVTGQTVAKLRMRDKRDIFNAMRTVEQISQNALFPQHGFTAGEFLVWQVLRERLR